MEYTIKLNEQQVEVLKTIFAQITPMPAYFPLVPKSKKLSKIEQTMQNRLEYRAMKAERKRKNNL